MEVRPLPPLPAARELGYAHLTDYQIALAIIHLIKTGFFGSKVVVDLWSRKFSDALREVVGTSYCVTPTTTRMKKIMDALVAEEGCEWKYEIKTDYVFIIIPVLPGERKALSGEESIILHPTP